MNTIGAGNQNINTIGVNNGNVSCFKADKDSLNTQDAVTRGNSGGSKPIGEELKAFASKMKAEVKETATEIGHGITGSENNKMNCAIGMAIGIMGTAIGSPLMEATGMAIIGFGGALALAGGAAGIATELTGLFSGNETEMCLAAGVGGGILL